MTLAEGGEADSRGQKLPLRLSWFQEDQVEVSANDLTQDCHPPGEAGGSAVWDRDVFNSHCPMSFTHTLKG